MIRRLLCAKTYKRLLTRRKRSRVETRNAGYTLNAMWRVEGLVVLAWALQLHSIPANDELVLPMELYTSIGLNDAAAGKRLLANPELRSVDEVQVMAEHLLAPHWRIRDFSIRPERMDYVEFSKECWFGSLNLSNFRTVDRNLAIGDVGIVAADPEEISRVGSLAMERHVAINWLRGYVVTAAPFTLRLVLTHDSGAFRYGGQSGLKNEP
jgi:hypothetical protein